MLHAQDIILLLEKKERHPRAAVEYAARQAAGVVVVSVPVIGDVPAYYFLHHRNMINYWQDVIRQNPNATAQKKKKWLHHIKVHKKALSRPAPKLFKRNK